MRVDVLTILPDSFEGPMSTSMIGLARERGLLDLHIHDLRDWTHDRHRTTDDSPYGGGPGMVMRPEPVFEAVRAISAMHPVRPWTIFTAPGGVRFTQSLAEEFSLRERLLLVCGRYEGLDERTYTLADQVISVGDYVLTGGELAAMVVIDAATRLIPGVLGHENSTADESFTTGLLEYPQYTRPPVFEGMEVPEVLRSGDHGRIAAWRRLQSVLRTAQRRPDLLSTAPLTAEEHELASDSVDRADALRKEPHD